MTTSRVKIIQYGLLRRGESPGTSPEHYVMLQRNLLYTALTRAKRLAILVGEHRALATAVNNRRVRSRFSRLAERLREKGGG